jgi:universal stress protein E
MSEHELESRKIVVVVDPSQDRPVALERILDAADVVRRRNAAETEVHVLLAVDLDNTDASCDNPNIIRESRWLFENVVEPLNKSGFKYSLQISWCSEWYDSIRKVVAQQNAGGVMLPWYGKSRGGRLFSESIWHLMRTSPAPVTIVQPNRTSERKSIVAAVNFQSHDGEYQGLNNKIIEVGKFVASSFGATLHLVNAYSDSLHYPDRSQLARTGIESENIHVYAGRPEDVIAKVVREVNADSLLLGFRSRPSRWRGATAERIIGKVDCDITTVSI